MTSLEDRPSSGSWGTGEQNSSSFDPSRTYGDGTHFSESHGTLAASTFLGPGLGGECPGGPCPHPCARSVLEHRGFQDGHPEQRTQVGTSQVPAGKWTPESRQPGEAESEAGPLACSPQSTGILTVRVSIGTWASFLPSELALSSPGPLSPSGVKGGPHYYSYSGHPRRRAADGGLDTQPKKVRKVPPGLPSSVSFGTDGAPQAECLS
ncbi:transcription factor E2-alpha isoform 3 [Pontoporia blainvillei]|uniref:Transcription factor E2-alpha isoform 3 n=1 Tax=Pontoporia blainvillei TaxID=48723 RepID=A0ABX0RZT2_PONBL|nr:transcription factor E2-alpha isoform 3 [Pontoporia blainvillei]